MGRDGDAGNQWRAMDAATGPTLLALATDEFIGRFLIHVLPKGSHRIRHYDLFAKASSSG